ncbi:MAG: sigma-70 family RNA polymerase sigma factor [Microthrixaceae bacterium]
MDTLTDDAELVLQVRGGDTAAMADLYDRHADHVFTLCAHLLGDREEAADVTSDVFLTALQRMDQLRDPSRLRPWLLAIARRLVYRRTRNRRRVTSLDRMTEGAGAATLDLRDGAATGAAGGPGDAHGDPEAHLDRVDATALADLLQDASSGLDERDRTVLELHLVQGLEGADIAAALGVTEANGYQLVHRMRERLGRSVSALLVARSARHLCDGLDEVADRWDGRWDVLWRKRFARHVDRCETCGRIGRRVPKAVLSGAAMSVAAQSAVLAAPISARTRFLEATAQGGAATAGDRGRGRWRSDGFPPGPRRRLRHSTGATVAVLVVMAVLVLGAGGLGDGTRTVLAGGHRIATDSAATGAGRAATDRDAPADRATEDAVDRATGDGTTGDGEVGSSGDGAPRSADTGGVTASTVTTVPTGPVAPAVPPAGSTAGPAAVTTVPVPKPPPQPPPPPASSTTVPADTVGPKVTLTGPACVVWPGVAKFTATAVDPGGIAKVVLTWTGATSGGTPMAGAGTGAYGAAVPMDKPVTNIVATATAYDMAGNAGRSAKVSVTGGFLC